MRQAVGVGTWRVLAGVFVALILLATLRPGSLAPESWIHGCVLCGPYGLADILRNLLLFLPLGLVLPRALGSVRAALMTMFLLTLGIEIAQLVIPGRDSNPTDVLFNTLGGAVGIAFGYGHRVWLRPGEGPRLPQIAAYVVLVLGGLTSVGFAANPVLPEGGLIGQWSPVRDGYAPFTGLVHGVEIDGAAVPSWTVPNGREVFGNFLEGAPVRLRFTQGSRTQEPQLLLRIVMPGHRELLMVGTQGDGVIVRPRTGLTEARLFEPAVVVPGALEGSRAGETVDLSVFREADRYCVRVDAGSEVCSPAMTAGRAWSPVVETDGWTIQRRVAMIVICFSLLALPLGWWGGVSAGGLATVALAGGVFLIAKVSGLVFVPWELAPLVVGTALGAGFRNGWNRRFGSSGTGTDLESGVARTSLEIR